MTQREREEAMLACDRCTTLPFRAALDGETDPQVLGYRIMGEHAAYVKPCKEHEQS